MNKYFKKFGIMFVMLLVLIGIGIIQHGTTANAATVGDALVNVQDGWKRYQVEDNPYLILNGFIQAYSGNSESNGHEIIYSQDVGTASFSFSFYGSKLLLRGYLGYNVSFKVSIDGKDETTNIKPIRDGYGMTYEKDNLDLRNHTVKITNVSGRTYFDSIDIDKDGYLIDSNESITLDKSSMDLSQGDSGQVTATVSTTTSAQVTWISSDPSVATVDSTGKVTAIEAGTAEITATTTDGSNLSASCTVNVTANNGGNNGGTTTGASAIVNIAYAKGDNTNNAGGDVSIIFNGVPDTTLSVVKTASVKSVWVGDTFTYTIVVTNTGSKIAKAVVINDSAPNHIQFIPSGIITTQGTVDPSSSASNIVVNVGDIAPVGTVTITLPATVVL